MGACGGSVINVTGETLLSCRVSFFSFSFCFPFFFFILSFLSFSFLPSPTLRLLVGFAVVLVLFSKRAVDILR